MRQANAEHPQERVKTPLLKTKANTVTGKKARQIYVPKGQKPVTNDLSNVRPWLLAAIWLLSFLASDF